MRKLALILPIAILLLVLSAARLLAQKSSAPATPSAKTSAGHPAAAADGPPSAAQVLKLLELLQVRDSLKVTLDGVKRQMRTDAEGEFREKIPNPSPEQMKSIAAIVEDSFSGISTDDMIKDVVPVYQKHLTRSDVRALVAFYSSPPGRKILREQPAMIRESMQATGTGQQKRMEAAVAQLDVRMQQFIEQEQGKADPAKK